MGLEKDCSEIRKMFKKVNEDDCKGADKKEVRKRQEEMGVVSVYHWGIFSVDDSFDKDELKEMEKLSTDDLAGFILRDQDESKTFYAYKEDIDRDAKETEGVGVKWAYGIVESKVDEGKPTIVAEPGIETETEPITTPDEPRVRPSKPRTPIRPAPSIQPKPKALNPDVELFLQKRGLSK